MRIVLRSALALGALAAASAAPSTAFSAPKDPSGTWLTEDGRAKIRVDRCGQGGAKVCGKVVWLKVPNWDDGTPRTDAKNPDPKKRSRPMIGVQLMSLSAEDDKYVGEIYNADSGKLYQVSLERESEAELSIQGCLLKVLCGSQTWTRVPDVNQQAANAAAKQPAKPAPVPPAKPDDLSED